MDHLSLAEYSFISQEHARQEEWTDWRFGQLNATIANVQRNEKTKPDPWLPDDFMPTRGPKKQAEASLVNPNLSSKLRAAFLELNASQ